MTSPVPDYVEYISRTGGAAELPEQLRDELVNGTIRQSTALSLGTRVPTTTRDSRIPVLATRPVARWISTPDIGLGQTSTPVWGNQSLLAEELMAICPIPKAVLWNVNKPPTWGPSVIEHATSAGNTVSGDVFNMATDNVSLVLQAAQQVSQQGFNVSGSSVAPGWQFRIPATRSASLIANPIGSGPFPLMLSGMPLAVDPLRWSPAVAARVDAGCATNSGSTAVADPSASAADLPGSYITGAGIPAGTEIVSVTAGTGYVISQAATATSASVALTVGRGSVDAVCGDWSKLLVGIRRDITVESFDSGVITNAAGAVELNLMQQDAVAFRITMRVGMLIVVPPGDSNYTGARSPFSLVLNSATSAGPVGAKAPVFPTPAAKRPNGR
jgi:hypothetical protein